MGRKKSKNKYYFFLEDFPNGDYVLWYSSRGRQYVVARYDGAPGEQKVVEDASKYLRVNSESG